MKAWHAWYKGGESPRHEIKVAMAPEEWEEIVSIVWNYAEDLDERTVANFLRIMENVGVES